MRRNLQRRLARPGDGAREHFVEHDADRINVRAGIGLSGRRDLRGDVGDRTEHVARRGHRDFGGSSRQTKVSHLRRPVGWNENVLGFDVAVNNADAVSGAQCLKNVGRVAQRLRDRERTLRTQ